MRPGSPRRTGERQRTFARFVPESELVTFEILHWATDVRRATFVDARRFGCPVLCIAGAYDRVNPRKTVASIARRYRSQGEHFEVANASHWPIGEPGWETTARFVREWVANVTSPVGV